MEKALHKASFNSSIYDGSWNWYINGLTQFLCSDIYPEVHQLEPNMNDHWYELFNSKSFINSCMNHPPRFMVLTLHCCILSPVTAFQETTIKTNDVPTNCFEPFFTAFIHTDTSSGITFASKFQITISSANHFNLPYRI